VLRRLCGGSRAGYVVDESEISDRLWR
jgi:hypothetical protein